MSQNSHYRVGVVGVGGRGLGVATICAGLPNAKVVAIADLIPERLDKATQKLGEMACYDHHTSMLQHEDLDMVVVATLGMDHKEPTVDAAAAGVKGIYVEKPMETSLAECDAMIEACEASGTKLSVGHQRRWWPEYQAVRDAIRSGALGQAVHGYVYWSTGRVGSMGTHLFDALNLVVDSDAAWVSARIDPSSQPWPQWPDVLDPGAMGFITYRNGVRIAVDVMDDVRQPIDMLFYGSRGRLYAMEDAKNIQYWARDAEPEGPYQGFIALPPQPFQSPPPPQDLSAHGAKEGLAELLECIENGREPASTGAHGRAVLEIIVAFHLSNQKQMQPVALPLTGDAIDLDLNFR